MNPDPRTDQTPQSIGREVNAVVGIEGSSGLVPAESNRTRSEDASESLERSLWLSEKVDRCLFAVGVVVAVLWAAWAIWAAPRGFDPFDEAWYIVTYRDARASDPLATIAPFLIRPVFDLFGGSIVALRIVKLLAWYAIGAYFGTSAARWINRTDGLRTVSARSIGMLFANAAMVVYAAFPPTPSYNDLSIGLLLVLGAIALRLAVTREDERRSTDGHAVAVGALMLLAGLTKATTGVMTAIVVMTILLVGSGRAPAWRQSWRRLIAAVAIGVGLCLVTIQIFVVDLVEFSRATSWTAGMITRTTVPGDVVWERQRKSVERMFALGWHDFWAVAVLALLAFICQMLGRRRMAAVVAAIAAVLGAVRLISADYFIGGWQRLASQPVGLIVLLCSSLAMLAVRSFRAPTVQRRVVLLALVMAVIPFVQGLGSNIPLVYLSIAVAPTWLLVALLAAVAQPPRGAAHIASTVTLCWMWILAITIAWTAMVVEPIRVWTPLWDQTVAPHASGLAGIRVDRATADFYDDLDALVNRTWTGEGRPKIIALTDAPGPIVATDAATVAGGWFFQLYPDRTVETLRRECSQKDWATRSAGTLLLLRDYGLTDEVVDVLAACGIDVFADYEAVGAVQQPMGYYPYSPTLTLWAPIGRGH